MIKAASRAFAANALAVAALVLAAAGAPAAWPILLVIVDVLFVVWRQRKRLRRPGLALLGTFGGPRLVLTASAIVLLSRGEGWPSYVATGSAVLLLLLVATESTMQRIWSSAGRTVENLPGTAISRPYLRHGGKVVPASLVLIVLLVLSTYVRVLGVLAAVAVLGLAVLCTVWFRRALRDRARLADLVATSLEAFAPQIMVYLSGPRGTEYQLKMWLPHLTALGRPFVVVVREGPLANAVASLTDAPVIACRTLAELERAQLPSLKVALYVNNGAKNSHNVRYRHMTHVQLLHGESDKPPSYNAVTAMFDKIFVAGQAGIDRYAKHGVNIPRDRFEIVGRPQVADITRGTATGEDRRTVLYAPTWTGFNADANFGSLPIGKMLVETLLADGWTVIFRPHPYSRSDAESRAQIAEIESALEADATVSGRAHLYGAVASSELTLTECFNASDALVSDVSSVPADYLFSEKPFAITQMAPLSPEEFVDAFPLSSAALVVRADEPAEIPSVLARLRHDDMAERRRGARVHYLGDIPVDSYADRFTDAVIALVDAYHATSLSAVETRGVLDDPGEAGSDEQDSADGS